MNNNNFWSPEIWKKINGEAAQYGQPGQPGNLRGAMPPNGQPPEPGALKEAMGKIRVAQQIFPTTIRNNDNPIPADTINLTTRVASAGKTKQLATIIKSFQLAPLHIQDPELTMAMNQVMLAAQSLALIEDALLFQGKDAVKALPENSGIEVIDAETLEEGLLGIAKTKIPVHRAGTEARQGLVFGAATNKAVMEGITTLQREFQAGPFALILDPETYLDVHSPFEDDSNVCPADAIERFFEKSGGQIAMSPSMPKNTGLLAALGGKTTQLYIGTGPTLEFDFAEGGKYFFTAKETIQFHNIDARSLVRLDFIQASNG
jgi:uncharacterized linocin/CFP29 family protein